jgi:hypothetical protein
MNEMKILHLSLFIKFYHNVVAAHYSHYTPLNTAGQFSISYKANGTDGKRLLEFEIYLQ